MMIEKAKDAIRATVIETLTHRGLYAIRIRLEHGEEMLLSGRGPHGTQIFPPDSKVGDHGIAKYVSSNTFGLWYFKKDQ